VKADYTSKGQTTWRKEAREDFDFEAGPLLFDEGHAGRVSGGAGTCDCAGPAEIDRSGTFVCFTQNGADLFA
jgi:hypothetical protein